MDSGNFKLIDGGYKALALTNASVAHSIDPNKRGDGVWLLATNDTHVRFGDGTQVTVVADPIVPGVTSPTPKDAMFVPKPRGAQHIAVLTPDNTGSMRVWLARRISR